MGRTIKTVIQGSDTRDGAGVSLHRVFGFDHVPLFDPYLMLDFFDSTNPDDYEAGFPWHPHRGIETITFLFSGIMEHSDSLGNSGRIGDGDCQWMTAGSGIIHQEMPKASPRMLGIQLWANLRAADKMTTPRYKGITASEVPIATARNARVRVIAGAFTDVSGAVHEGAIQRPDIAARFLDVDMAAGGTFMLETEPAHRVFALLVSGGAAFADGAPPVDNPGSAILYDTGSRVDSLVTITASPKGSRMLLVSGIPIGESVAWGGPIVMNTRAELDQAFAEYRGGTFIKDQARFM